MYLQAFWPKTYSIFIWHPYFSRRNGETGDTYDYDEIASTFKVRYMTSMEAYLRLFSYKIVDMSHQIYTLSVHDEGGQSIVLEEGHEEESACRQLKNDTRLTAFFKLCQKDWRALSLTYDRIPYYYRLLFRSAFLFVLDFY